MKLKQHFQFQELIEMKENNLVASYTACLPCELQVEIYAKFLQGKYYVLH